MRSIPLQPCIHTSLRTIPGQSACSQFRASKGYCMRIHDNPPVQATACKRREHRHRHQSAKQHIHHTTSFTSVRLNCSTTQALRPGVEAVRSSPFICVINDTQIDKPIPRPTSLLVVNGFNSDGNNAPANRGRYHRLRHTIGGLQPASEPLFPRQPDRHPAHLPVCLPVPAEYALHHLPPTHCEQEASAYPAAYGA